MRQSRHWHDKFLFSDARYNIAVQALFILVPTNLLSLKRYEL